MFWMSDISNWCLNLLWLIWTIVLRLLLATIHWPLYQKIKTVSILLNGNCKEVIRHGTFVFFKVSTDYWAAKKSISSAERLSKDSLLWWTWRKSNVMNSWPFCNLETVCIFPLYVIALQFIFRSRDFEKIESSKRQQQRELHSTDLHVAEVVR